jgi:hypothetical protein
MHSPHFPSFARAFVALTALVTVAYGQVPTWTKTTPAEAVAAGIGVQVTGADYGNGTFVLAAYLGGTTATPAITPAVWTSPDGATWTRRTLPVTGSRVGSPRFINGKFFLGMDPATNANGVPTGVNGAVLSSADGITWSASPISSPIYIYNFVFGNGTYLALGNPAGGSTTTQIVTSADGATWTPRTVVAGGYGNSVAFFNGKFYCTASVSGTAALYTSDDAVTWTRLTTAPANLDAYHNLAVSPTTLLVPTGVYGNATQSLSTDGTTFVTGTPGIALVAGSMRYVNGAFITPAPADSSTFDVTLARASFDGRTWTTIGSTANFSDGVEIAYGNGRYVFVGEFNVYSGTSTITPGGTSGGGTGGGTTTPPTITASPVAQTVTAGGAVTFSVTASGTGNTYQWLFNGNTISGATSASYTINNVTAANAGSYAVRVTSSSGGTSTTNAATLTVAAAGSAGAYLANLSIRAFAGSGSQTLIVGVTVGGAGTSGAKNVLVRGIGPALAGFGLASAITDPKLTAFAGSTAIGGNDNWVPGEVAATASAVGAFPLTTGSKDAAFLGSGVTAGSYSIILEGVNNTSGIALAELYDATPAASFTAATPRFTNVSSRTFVGAGDQTLICGFVVGGTGTRRILIRAVGPGLAQFGLTGLLADPQLALYNGTNTQIASNDNWDSAATLPAQQSVGAFALPASSKDSVLVATVSPGAYTVTITGVGGGTGTALIELYELP